MEVLLVLEKGYKYSLFQGSLIKKREKEKEIPWIKSKGKRGASLFQLLTHSSSGRAKRKAGSVKKKKRKGALSLLSPSMINGPFPNCLKRGGGWVGGGGGI